MFIRMIGLLVVIGLLQACATTNTAPPSEALQVVRAGGLDGLRDLTDEELNKLWKIKDPKNGSVVARTAMAAGTAMDIYAPPPGFSKGGSTALLSMGAVLSLLNTGSPESMLRLIVWMPKDEAATPEEARAKLRGYIELAYQKALPNHQVVLVKDVAKNRGKRSQWYIKITGENCVPECGVYGGVLNHEKPTLDKAPEFLGGYDAWTWKHASYSRTRGMCCGGYSVTEGGLSLKQKLSFLRDVSGHLPSWVYYYTPPHKNLAGLPMVFNSGRQMLFVQPKKQGGNIASLQ